jgi:hypothetical protein
MTATKTKLAPVHQEDDSGPKEFPPYRDRTVRQMLDQRREHQLLKQAKKEAAKSAKEE